MRALSGQMQLMINLCCSSWLTHFCQETSKRVIGKQCRPRLDATKFGIWSGSTLFALITGISINYSNNSNYIDLAVSGMPLQIPTLSPLSREKWKIMFLSQTLNTRGSHVESQVKSHIAVKGEIAWWTDGWMNRQKNNVALTHTYNVRMSCNKFC